MQAATKSISGARRWTLHARPSLAACFLQAAAAAGIRPRPTSTPRPPYIALQRHRSTSSLVRQLPLAVQLPPVQLPVSGRTLGRHVSLGPGWEQNKEGAAQQYSDEPSTSQAAAEAASPPEVRVFVLRLHGRLVMGSSLCSGCW